ncbi:hypothetical protein SAMN04487860_11282 [Ruminococcus flavefaciens]|uniref:Uncharacterized protein n=2 Tax=Ruminococcus flavefaciens TaxID=1265 RepID=A0A1M7LA77_RUMFL|nr:hypothetical protein SAMN04487860_11282 [Ruminococcus flavefaciens]
MDKSILDKINKFTRRTLSENEVYVFSVILCDNDIDRDCERFSEKALDTLREKFIGKTGIFDHDTSTANQNARIFDTELITDDSRLTQYGKPYVYLKAMAYMVRTDENKNLIAEIDGGIKKEVSISCSAARRICSVCGNDKNINTCNHVKGKIYGGKLCHNVLDDITDAYEWSFVAVPAQVNAGVTKKYSDDTAVKSQARDIQLCDDELRRDIRRFAYFAGGRAAADIASISAANMNTQQLIALRKSFEAQCGKAKTEVQLEYSAKSEDTAESFTMK